MTTVERDMAEPSALSIAQREMRSGERLIWADRPAPGRLALTVWPASLFGLPFAGFAAFWIFGALEATAGEQGAFSFFPLFGLPFLLIGLGIVLTPVWAWIGAKKTVYAISSDRLVIINGRSVRSFEPDEIDDLERREHADGSGDVIFRREYRRSRGRRGGRRTRVRKIGFYGIPDARRVEDEIRRLKDRARD